MHMEVKKKEKVFTTDVEKPLSVQETSESRKRSTPLFPILYVNWISFTMEFIACKMWSTLWREVSINVNESSM